MFLRMSGREAGIGAKAEIGAAALVEGRKPIKRRRARTAVARRKDGLAAKNYYEMKNKLDEWQRG